MNRKTSAGRTRRIAACLFLFSLAGALVTPATLLAQQGEGQGTQVEGEQITLNLQDAELASLIDTVAEVTGRNFVVDPRVSARVTVISKRAVNVDELYQIFLSILQVHGFSAIPSGEVTKIVPDASAKQLGPRGNGGEHSGDEIVTRVVQVDNVPVDQLVPILRPLIPQQGHFAAYPPSNVLIISDRASNVRRLRSMIERIDQETDNEMEVIRLENASAVEVARILESLQPQGEGAAGRPRLQIAADQRTNSILLGGPEKRRLRLRAIAAHLDTPVADSGDTRVIYLRYAKAEELVEVVRGVLDNVAVAGQGEGGEATAPSGPDSDAEASIQADAATNSLIISGPPRLQREIKAVIQQLDVRRAQVVIEAAIAEVSQNMAAELGFQWAVDGSENSEAGVGGTSFDAAGGGSLTNIIGAITQEQPVNPGSGLSLAIGDLSGTTRFAVLLRALASDTDTNILSTPSLVTLDNEEAEIRVAQNVPFVTGEFTNTGAGGGGNLNPFQTIERRDVGIILKVTPQINEGNSVQLQIEQEVSNVADSTEAVDLITNRRSIKTNVLVDDGKLVILGGLLDEQVRESEQSVPLLGDLPLLGNLFRYQTSNSQKRNLMVFLRPRIIRDETSMTRYASRKYNYMRASQLAKREQGVALLPDKTAPLLPEGGRPSIPEPFTN